MIKWLVDKGISAGCIRLIVEGSFVQIGQMIVDVNRKMWVDSATDVQELNSAIFVFDLDLCWASMSGL